MIAIIVIFVIAIAGTWYAARWWYQNCYQPVVNDLVYQNSIQEQTIDNYKVTVENYKQILAGGVRYTSAEIIGEAITEPEHLYEEDEGPIGKHRKVKHKYPWEQDTDSSSAIGHRDDEDRRIPGSHQP